jgi:cell wall-associated NlpC family hydrolase
VKFVLSEAGLNVPDYIDINGRVVPIRHANEFWDHYGVAVHNGLHQPGDLIFFSRNGYFPTHIGLVRDEESYIHSPGINNTKVCVAEIEEREIPGTDPSPRIVFQKNPIGYKSPTVPLNTDNYRYIQHCL